MTENKLTIQHLVSSDDQLLQRLAFAAIDPDSSKGSGTQASFDAAFAAFIPEAIQAEAAALSITEEVPFDPAARRRRVVLVDKVTGRRYLVVIGSPETLLEIAASPQASQYREVIASEGRQGLRHLAFAYRELPMSTGEGGDVLADERDLTLLGFVSLADPLRPSTAQTIVTAERLGVAIKVLTGDSPEVAGYVAAQVGLLTEGNRVYVGDELAQMAPADLARVVTESNVFALGLAGTEVLDRPGSEDQ